MKFLAVLAVTGLSLIGRLGADPSPPATVAATGVCIVPATDTLVGNAAKAGDSIRELLKAASPTIGTPYQWGGVNLETGVDCSNYTW